MSSLGPILDHAVPFGLVMARVAGLFIAGPVVSNAGVPMRARALLVAALAAALYPVVPTMAQSGADTGWLDLLPMILGEALVGFVMGLVASLPLLAMDMAGSFSGQIMGLGLARVYNPEMDTDFDVLGQFLFIMAGAIFVMLGGVETLFLTLAGTFRTLPAGGIGLADTPVDLFVATLTSGLELALRVSLPVVGIVGLLTVILGAVGKTMPQLNVMNVGFTLKSFGGLAMLTAALGGVAIAAGDEIDQVLRHIAVWASELGVVAAD
jgi:flagellar biosynthesis protein FliR